MMATVSGTNVQMEMVSRTHKCLRGNDLIDHLTSVEKMQMTKVLETHLTLQIPIHFICWLC
jgi:hypothetical protein